MELEYITKCSAKNAKKYKKINICSFFNEIDKCYKHYNLYNYENLDPMSNSSISLHGLQFQELYCRGDNKAVKKLFHKLYKLSDNPDPQIRRKNYNQIEKCINNINGGEYSFFSTSFIDFIIKTKSKVFSSLRISVSGYGPSLYRIVYFLEPRELYQYNYWKLINQKNTFVFNIKKNKKYLSKYYLNNFINILFIFIKSLRHEFIFIQKINKGILKKIFHFIKSKNAKRLFFMFNKKNNALINEIIQGLLNFQHILLRKRIQSKTICTNLFTVYYDSTSNHKKENLKKLEKKLFDNGNKYLLKRFRGIIGKIENELPCTMIASFSLQHYYIPVGNYHFSLEHETTQIINCLINSDSKHTNYIDYKNAQLFAPITEKKHCFSKMYMKQIKNIEVLSTPNTEELSSICIEYQLLKNYYKELIEIRNLYYKYDFKQINKLNFIKKHIYEVKFNRTKKNINITEAIVDFINSENRNNNNSLSYGSNPYQTKYYNKYELSDGTKREDEYFQTYKERIKYLLIEIEKLLQKDNQIYKDRNEEKNIEINNKIQKYILILTFCTIVISLLPYKENIKNYCKKLITNVKELVITERTINEEVWEKIEEDVNYIE